MLLTGRVLRTLGVGPALFIVPTAMMLGSIGVLVLGSIVAAAALKASDQVLRYSIDKATVELLYLPVPSAHTFRVKSFIDTVVYRLGDAGGGLVVLLFAAVLGWSPAQVSIVGIVLVGAWMVAAFVARRQYVENLRESIHQHRVDHERASMPVMDRDTTQLISSRLKGNTREIAYALSLFEMAHDRKVHPAVRGLLNHDAARDPPAGDPPPGARRRRHREGRGRAAGQGSQSRSPHRSAALPDRVRSTPIRWSASSSSATSRTSRSGPRWWRSWPGPATRRTSMRPG